LRTLKTFRRFFIEVIKEASYIFYHNQKKTKVLNKHLHVLRFFCNTGFLQKYKNLTFSGFSHETPSQSGDGQVKLHKTILPQRTRAKYQTFYLAKNDFSAKKTFRNASREHPTSVIKAQKLLTETSAEIQRNSSATLRFKYFRVGWSGRIAKLSNTAKTH